MQEEKTVVYSTKNTYETLNQLTDKTKNVWVVLHGIGYLSRYFIKYFDQLPADENYIITPQAPSKYYLKNEYKHVGASWLTKEKTVMETANVLNYLDAVLEKEQLPQHLNFIVFGYSQGVSVATRWVAKRKLRCDRLILHSGGLPRELKAEDFSFLSENGTKVTAIVGDNDEYIDAEILKSEAQRMETLFDGQAEQIIFEGKHEVKKELLIQFAE
jgi:predicted esterase